ncbi:hypothetical protein GOP47_0006855 [Adiantum capillus-veneris]|uniref:Uncharacterized protein n=1 Tax=Adiantum capillus-veneris TaxID=13818 RepID=A0A9D4V3N1_ADICA|nr:hypothetical protein GOP47_0006855 [Adiantum capillus-veneris]
MSVDVGIRLLRAADHLLYQECADDCMAYLASAPWSDKEEEAIDDAISSMGLKPSSDLAARLTSADDMKVFKEVIKHLTEKAGCGEKGVAALHDFVNATFNEAPAQATCVCMSMIREAWTTATKNLITGNHLRSVSLWNTLTILALEYGDAKSFLADFIGCSKKLCGAMTRIRERFSVAEVLIQVFLRVIPGKANNKLVLLSNSQRLALLAAWAPMVADLKCKSLESAFRQLFTTLPLQDPVLIALVKEETTNPQFGDCYAWWRTKLFKRMKRCNSAREEIDLEASNSSKERVKLVSGEES